MKKLLLTFLLSALILGSAFAQFNITTNTNIGQTLKAVNTLNPDTFIVHFNTAIVNSTWAYNTAEPPMPVITYRKCQTQKGLRVLAYVDTTTTSAYGFGSSDCRDYTQNRNPIHVASLDSLKNIMNKSIITGATGGNVNDTISRPAACLFDVATDDQAFGMYPGKCKRIEYAFYYNLIGKAAIGDISFSIDTYNAGNTGKTASYELAAYYSTTSSNPTISDDNLLAPKVAGAYITGTGKITVNLAEALGISTSTLSNKRIVFFYRTRGTSNASGIVDGNVNPVDANNVPTLTDPIIVFDDFVLTYGASSWDVPVGAVANAVFNHNNGAPVVTTSTDYSGGTAVPVYPATDYPVYFNITGKDRLSVLDIFEANDGGGHMSAFSFAATGAVKKKAVDGTYSIDVPYTYTASDGTTPMKISIPAPVSGSSNDTLQIQLLANVPNLATRAVRLEITNGIRFWYNVSALGDVSTSVDKANNNGITAFSANNLLYVINTTDNITLYNIAGQKVKSVSTSDASKGIRLNSGIYIVKTGSTVQKVIVY